MESRTCLPVGSVATSSGFKTLFHFARKVKQAIGLSPPAQRARERAITSDGGLVGPRVRPYSAPSPLGSDTSPPPVEPKRAKAALDLVQASLSVLPSPS